MEYLTLEYIKEHSRICHNAEDNYLKRIGAAAERAVMNLCMRDVDDLYDTYGGIPEDLMHATLLLVDHLYQHHGPTEQVSVSNVPYSIDFMLKPYMRLTLPEEKPVPPTMLGSDVKVVFGACLPDDMTLADVDFTGLVYVRGKMESAVTFTKADAHKIGEGRKYCYMFNSSKLGIGRYLLRLTLHVPDEDYPEGYSTEVIEIDPRINVKR